MNNKWMLSGLLLLLAGCGGDDNREPSTEPDNLAEQGGYAADGYLVGAKVCLDTNKDLSCTDEQTTATTDENGQFSLYASASLFEEYEVIVEAVAGVTVDLDNPGTPISKGYTLRAPAGLKDSEEKIPVTPISTVLAVEKEAAPDKTVLEVVNDSSFAEQLCPLATTEAEKKDCITKDYVKDADSTDDTTRVLAQRKQLTARVLASMLSDAQEKAGDSNGKKAAGNTLSAKSNQVVNQLDEAIGKNGGDFDGVDTGKLAEKNSIVGGEGSNALINASEVPSEKTTVIDAFKASAATFNLNDTAITADRLDVGNLRCGFGGCSTTHGQHRLRKGVPISDWDTYSSQDYARLQVVDGAVKLIEYGFVIDEVHAEFALAAQKLSLQGRSISQLMDTFSASANRKWRHVLNQCSVFEAGAIGHIVSEPTRYQVNNPAYAFYGVIPATVIPTFGDTPPDFYEEHDIATIISTFTGSVGTFSVYVGPDVYVTLADGSAEFFKASTSTSLGTVSYRIEAINLFLGAARVVVINNLDIPAEEALYIDQTRENLGIAVSRDSWLKKYQPKGSLGTVAENAYGVGVFGTNAPSAPRFYLNTAAAEQLKAAVDVSALASPARDLDVATDCSYTVKTGVDSDGDGVDDGEDAFPDDASESGDIDGDGTGDNADSDRDGDGVDNDNDAFPNDPTETSDLDGDGVGDNADTDRDGDGVINDDDAFADDSSESGDLDGDGVGDNSDEDRDGDTVWNDQDAFPDDPNEFSDIDGDGIGDNSDLDRDGDGVNNVVDAFPNDPTETLDSDGDGVGDNSDPTPNGGGADSDGDGFEDSIDAFPDNPAEWEDADGDGVGDNSDPDPSDPLIPGDDFCDPVIDPFCDPFGF